MIKLPDIPKRIVYLDHAATTPTDPSVVQAMLPFFTENFGNPSGLYSISRDASDALADARERIAKILNSRSEEIIFTSGGTESDNLALFGIARKYGANPKWGKHVITSQIEHHAVLLPTEVLKKEGFEITETPVNADGEVSIEKIIGAIKKETVLISIMYANNEVGTIQPIAEIGRAIAKWKKENGRGPMDPPFFHTDACQAAGTLMLDVAALHVDLLTLNGSKIYGPKGVGLLYCRRGVQLTPHIVGGGQELRIRSGTENVPAIVGLACALQRAQENHETENIRLTELREYFWSEIQTRVPKLVLNGHPSNRLPNNLNFTILDIEGEAVLLYLDEYGISCSTGSACTSTSLDPSHVILAMGKPYEYAHGSLRFTLGHTTTRADIDHVLSVLPPVVELLRSISPINLSLDQKQETLAARSAFVEDGVPHWMKKT
jgi:cysteine desulfurase